MMMKLHFKIWAVALLLTAIAPSITASADANFPEDGHYYVLRNCDDWAVYYDYVVPTMGEYRRVKSKQGYTTPTDAPTKEDMPFLFKFEKYDDSHYYIKNVQTQKYLGRSNSGYGEFVGLDEQKENCELLIEYHASETVQNTTLTDVFTIRNDHYTGHPGSYWFSGRNTTYGWLAAWDLDIGYKIQLWKFEEVNYDEAQKLDEAQAALVAQGKPEYPLPEDGYYIIRNVGENYLLGANTSIDNWRLRPLENTYTASATPTEDDLPYIFKVTRLDYNRYLMKNVQTQKYIGTNRNGDGSGFGWRNVGLTEQFYDMSIAPVASLTSGDNTYTNVFAIYSRYDNQNRNADVYPSINGTASKDGSSNNNDLTNLSCKFLYKKTDDYPAIGLVCAMINSSDMITNGDGKRFPFPTDQAFTTANTFYFEKLSDQDAAAELDAAVEGGTLDEVNASIENLEDGYYYYITANAGLTGQSLYSNVSATNPALIYYGTSNQPADPDRSEAKFIFKLTKDEQTGHCTLKNIVNQKYIGCVGVTGNTANGLAIIKTTPYSLLIGYPDNGGTKVTSSYAIRADQAQILMAGDAIDVRSGGYATFLNDHTVYNRFTFESTEGETIERTMQQVTIASSGFATAIFGYDAVVPEGVTVYTASQDNSSSVSLTEIDETVIPAGTAIVVSGTAGETYTFAVDESTTDAAALAETNILKGNVTEETATTDETQTFYGLATGTDGKAVFKKVQAGVAVPAGKGYIVTTTSASSPEFLDLSGAATGISSAAADTHNDGRLYDLQGRRIEKPVKGVYIRDGKKVVIK